MDLQIYEKDKFVEMDSMHDSIATNISIKDKTLLITYDNLNEGVIGRDGLPYYKNQKLTIEYVIDSYCDVKFFRRNKYKYVDLLEENKKFYELINGCSFMSYKYAIDSFGEIILFFNIREKTNIGALRSVWMQKKLYIIGNNGKTPTDIENLSGLSICLLRSKFVIL